MPPKILKITNIFQLFGLVFINKCLYIWVSIFLRKNKVFMIYVLMLNCVCCTANTYD